MSQTHEVAPAEQPGSDAMVPGPRTTGNDRVDAVLRSLDELEDRPVEEHVEVFEAAHRELRSALDGSAERG